jgi:thiol:disulfide interchange protein
VCVALGARVFGRWGGVAEPGRRQLAAALAGTAVAAAGGFAFLDMQMDEVATCDTGEVRRDLTWDEGVPWQPFTDERLTALDGTVVFADFTADWCLTCKVNERTVLDTDAVTDAMQELSVVPLKADWTRRDENITRWLRNHGRAGVPMYLVIPADRSRPPILLPEVITPGMVTAALREAAGAGA